MATHVTTATLTAFDPEDLSARLSAYGDFEHVQLTNGSFRGQLIRSHFADSILDVAEFSQGVLVRGSYPRDRVTLGILVSADEAAYFNGTHFAVNGIVVIAEAAAMDAFQLPAGSRLIGFQTNRNRLEREGIDIPDRSRMKFLSRLSREGLLLSRYLKVFIQSQANSSRSVSRESLLEEDDLIMSFRRAIDAASELDHRRHRLAYRKRRRTLRKFEDFVADRLSSDFRIPDLCAEIGVSQRALEYLCNDHYGMSPRRYLTVRRLNAVRDSLLNPKEDGNSIAVIAGRFGINHPGRFARQYRSLFGELPSKSRQERIG